MQLEEQTLKAEIDGLKETLARTTEIIQAPVKMTTREDVAQTIKQGLIAQAKLDQALKELNDLKARYSDCVPKTVQEERDAAEADLEEAHANLEEKERQVDNLESSILGARLISTRIFNAGQPTATVFNVFVHEYSQLMLLKAPHNVWRTTKNPASWVNFWKTLTHKEQGIIAIAWMLGWEEVERPQVAIVLAGSMPARAIAGVVDLIIRYQADIQMCPVATLTPFFNFHSRLYPDIPQGAEIQPSEQAALLEPTLKLLSKERVTKALDIISLSLSNRCFGGANLLIAASRARGHGTLISEALFYGKFNPFDFSLPGTFSKEDRQAAEAEFAYKSQLEPSESGEITPVPGPLPQASLPSASNAPPSPPSEDPLHPPSPVSLTLPAPPPPRKIFMSKPVLQQCADLEALPEEERPGYEFQPFLLPEQHPTVPFDLIKE